MAILYPVVLAPLFNKFEPVRDVELSEKIRTQMEKSGIRVKKILQMDAGFGAATQTPTSPESERPNRSYFSIR